MPNFFESQFGGSPYGVGPSMINELLAAVQRSRGSGMTPDQTAAFGGPLGGGGQQNTAGGPVMKQAFTPDRMEMTQKWEKHKDFMDKMKHQRELRRLQMQQARAKASTVAGAAGAAGEVARLERQPHSGIRVGNMPTALDRAKRVAESYSPMSFGQPTAAGAALSSGAETTPYGPMYGTELDPQTHSNRELAEMLMKVNPGYMPGVGGPIKMDWEEMYKDAPNTMAKLYPDISAGDKPKNKSITLDSLYKALGGV